MKLVRRAVRMARVVALVSGFTITGVLAFAQGSASARSTTLHFFSKNVSSEF